jgi:hypothetical protein
MRFDLFSCEAQIWPQPGAHRSTLFPAFLRPGIGLPLFTNCLEEVFSETGLPTYSILGSYSKRCGEGRIRTTDADIGGVAPFEAAAFNHSATSPREKIAHTRVRCNGQMAYICLGGGLYSPNCREGDFSETRIQDPA